MIRRAVIRRFAACVLLGAGVGCAQQPIFDSQWPDAYWRSGSFVLLAIDTEAQMALHYDSHYSPGLVGPTVFSVGANDHYVVAKQHPARDATTFDRSVTNYYVVDRTVYKYEGEKPKIEVLGPFTRAEFDSVSRTLELPKFTKTFATLEWQSTRE